MRKVIAVGLGMGIALGAGCGDDATECGGSGVACLWAGQTGSYGLSDDGTRREDIRFYWVIDMEWGPDGLPYVLDWNNHLLRRFDANDEVETIVGDLTGFPGDGAPAMADLTAPGAPGDTIGLNHPTDIQFDDAGDLIFAAWHNHKLRVVDLDTGMVTVLCGRGAGFAGDGGTQLSAVRFSQPKNIVRTADGRIYVLDQRNHRIRRLDPAAGTTETVVGSGMPGFSGDDGPALMAQLQFEAGPNPEPSGGFTVADDGTIYVSDGLNHRIRSVTPDGIIRTVVGTGEPGDGGDGGPGAAAQINHARDVEIGPDGRVYFADTENNRIRAWDPATEVVTTVAGTGVEGAGEPGADATEVALNRPLGIAFDAEGALYVSDTYNSRILKVEP